MLGAEQIEIMLNKARELTEEEAILHDSELPGVSDQANETMTQLFISVLECMAYFLALSQDHGYMLPENMAKQDPYILVQRALRFPQMEPDSSADLEDVLFACLGCRFSDDTKVAAVECLARIRTDRLKPEDIAQMVKVNAHLYNMNTKQCHD